MSPTPSIFFLLHLLMLRPSILLARLEPAPLNELQLHLPADAVEPELPHLLVPHACVRCDVCWVLGLQEFEAVLARYFKYFVIARCITAGGRTALAACALLLFLLFPLFPIPTLLLLHDSHAFLL